MCVVFRRSCNIVLRGRPAIYAMTAAAASGDAVVLGGGTLLYYWLFSYLLSLGPLILWEGRHACIGRASHACLPARARALLAGTFHDRASCHFAVYTCCARPAPRVFKWLAYVIVKLCVCVHKLTIMINIATPRAPRGTSLVGSAARLVILLLLIVFPNIT